MNKKEFKSKIEELAPTEELVFDATPGFGKYREFMGSESVKHPAKISWSAATKPRICFGRRKDLIVFLKGNFGFV